MSTAEEVDQPFIDNMKKLAEIWDQCFFEILKTAATQTKPIVVVHDDVMDAVAFGPLADPEPTWMRKLNANQRRKKFRYLTKKWETQIAVEQVKSRLNGRPARSAERLAVEMEEADQKRRREAHKAFQTPAKVLRSRPQDGRRL